MSQVDCSTRGKESEAIRLAALFHRRWTVPILAELHRTSGARFVALVHRLGASQGAIRQTLDALLELGLVMRNPGYGHPLRPEYLLTRAGEAVAPVCRTLVEVLGSSDLEEVALRKWPLPILYALGEQPARYSEIRDRLPGITDRALAGALKDLQATGLLARNVMDAYPPAVEYTPTPLGMTLRSSLDTLAEALG